MQDFASHLVNARKQSQLTQTQLAARAGLTASYLSFIENRKKPPPSDEVCRRLAAALGLPAEDLLERAHMERAPKELRARVEDLTSSLHRERTSLRSFLEGLLSPFLFAGPPGYADSALDVLAISPARRRRIREAARRPENQRARSHNEIRVLLEELSDDELRDLAAHVPRLIENQPLHDLPLRTSAPDAASPEATLPYLFAVLAEHVGALPRPAPGDRVLVDPAASPEAGDLLLLRGGDDTILVRRLVEEDALCHLEGGDPAPPAPLAELLRQLAPDLCGVLIEIRTPLRKRQG